MYKAFKDAGYRYDVWRRFVGVAEADEERAVEHPTPGDQGRRDEVRRTVDGLQLPGQPERRKITASSDKCQQIGTTPTAHTTTRCEP